MHLRKNVARDAVMLKMKERGSSQGMCPASGSWKMQGNRFSSRGYVGWNAALSTPWFQPSDYCVELPACRTVV